MLAIRTAWTVMTLSVSEKMSFQTDTRLNGQLSLHFFMLTIDLDTLIQVDIPVATKFQRSPLSRRQGITGERPNKRVRTVRYVSMCDLRNPARHMAMNNTKFRYVPRLHYKFSHTKEAAGLAQRGSGFSTNKSVFAVFLYNADVSNWRSSRPFLAVSLVGW